MTFLAIGVEILNFNLLLAATISFGLASINGYLLNKKFTFGGSGRATFSQYLKFLGISIIGLCLTLTILHLLTALLGLHYIIAKICTIIIVVIWNYEANVMWTFKGVQS